MMATRMLQFQIENISPKVDHNLKKMHKFLDMTYSGVGCMFCDADNHQFIKSGEKQMVMSEHFCRDVTSNSLDSLLYLHIHYVRFYQLVSQFVTQCDHKGNHDEAASVPAEAAMKVDETISKELAACREFRNEPDWLNSCKFICDNFSLVNLSETFYPNIDLYSAATTYLSTKLKEREDAQKADEEKNKPKTEGEGEGEGEGEKKDDANKENTENKENANSQQERILEKIRYHRDVRMLEGETQTQTQTQTPEGGQGTNTTTPNTEGGTGDGKPAEEQPAEEKGLVPVIALPKTPEEEMANAKNPAVFSNLENSAKIDEFKKVFEAKGMDPYTSGKEADMADDKMKSIRDAVDAAEAEAAKKASEGGEGTPETKTSGGWWSIHVSRLFVNSLMFVFAAFMFGF
jgi:hypothetical protein